ncbi:MAG: hypothetical protein M0005_17260 [Actinomycetota bacterium]|jgi:GNAT superfamily N-acetyltransferase|nr:hypothetical protein [Actinomycetota bacterium]
METTLSFAAPEREVVELDIRPSGPAGPVALGIFEIGLVLEFDAADSELVGALVVLTAEGDVPGPAAELLGALGVGLKLSSKDVTVEVAGGNRDLKRGLASLAMLRARRESTEHSPASSQLWRLEEAQGVRSLPEKWRKILDDNSLPAESARIKMPLRTAVQRAQMPTTALEVSPVLRPVLVGPEGPESSRLAVLTSIRPSPAGPTLGWETTAAPGRLHWCSPIDPNLVKTAPDQSQDLQAELTLAGDGTYDLEVSASLAGPEHGVKIWARLYRLTDLQALWVGEVRGGAGGWRATARLSLPRGTSAEDLGLELTCYPKRSPLPKVLGYRRQAQLLALRALAAERFAYSSLDGLRSVKSAWERAQQSWTWAAKAWGRAAEVSEDAGEMDHQGLSRQGLSLFHVALAQREKGLIPEAAETERLAEALMSDWAKAAVPLVGEPHLVFLAEAVDEEIALPDTGQVGPAVRAVASVTAGTGATQGLSGQRGAVSMKDKLAATLARVRASIAHVADRLEKNAMPTACFRYPLLGWNDASGAEEREGTASLAYLIEGFGTAELRQERDEDSDEVVVSVDLTAKPELEGSQVVLTVTLVYEDEDGTTTEQPFGEERAQLGKAVEGSCKASVTLPGAPGDAAFKFEVRYDERQAKENDKSPPRSAQDYYAWCLEQAHGIGPVAPQPGTEDPNQRWLREVASMQLPRLQGEGRKQKGNEGEEAYFAAGRAVSRTVALAWHARALAAGGLMSQSAWEALVEEARDVVRDWEASPAGRLTLPLTSAPSRRNEPRGGGPPSPPEANVGLPGLLASLVGTLATEGFRLGAFAEALYDFCGTELTTPQAGAPVVLGCLLDRSRKAAAAGRGDAGTVELRKMAWGFQEVYPAPEHAFLLFDEAFEDSVKVARDEALRAADLGAEPALSVRWQLKSFEKRLSSLEGPSFGAPFAVGLLATMKGVALDARGNSDNEDDDNVDVKLFITGEVKDGGTLEKIGSPSAKLPAAARRKAELVLVPEGNLDPKDPKSDWRLARVRLASQHKLFGLPLIRPARDLSDALDKAWRQIYSPSYGVLAPEALFGREKEVARIEGLLQEDVVVVLHADAELPEKRGIGKTAVGATASELAAKLFGHGRRVVRTAPGRDADPAVAPAVVGSLATVLGRSLPVVDYENKPLDVARTLRGTLEHGLSPAERVLFFWDDAGAADAELIDAVLPRKHCAAIVTTLQEKGLEEGLTRLGRRVEPVPIGLLSEQAALSLLKNEACPSGTCTFAGDFGEVVQRVGRSPLDLVLAGADLKETAPEDDAEFRDWLGSWQRAGQPAVVPVPPRAVEKLSKEARRALACLSVLPEQPEWFDLALATHLVGSKAPLRELVRRCVVSSGPGGRLSVHSRMAEQARAMATTLLSPQELQDLNNKAAAFYIGRAAAFLNEASFSSLLEIEGEIAYHDLRHLVHHLKGTGDPGTAAAAFSAVALWAFWWWDYFVPWPLVNRMLDLAPTDDGSKLAEAAQVLRSLRSSYVPETKWQRRWDGDWQQAHLSLERLDQGFKGALDSRQNIVKKTMLKDAMGMARLLLADCARFKNKDPQPGDLDLAYKLSKEAKALVPQGKFNHWWALFYEADSQVARWQLAEAVKCARAAFDLVRASDDGADHEVMAHLERAMADAAQASGKHEQAGACLRRALAHTLRFHVTSNKAETADAYTQALHKLMAERLCAWLDGRPGPARIAAAREMAAYFMPGNTLDDVSLRSEAGNLLATVAVRVPLDQDLNRPPTGQSGDWPTQVREIWAKLSSADPLLDNPVPAWEEITRDALLLVDKDQAIGRGLQDEVDKVLCASFPEDQYVPGSYTAAGGDEGGEDATGEARQEVAGPSCIDKWVIGCGADGHVRGVVIGESYRKSGGFLFAYAATRPGQRGRGTGSALMRAAQAQWLAEPGSFGFIEVDDGRFHAEVNEDWGEPWARLRFYSERCGVMALEMPYFQPSLDEGLRRSYHMVLGVVPFPGRPLPPALPSKQVKAFWQDYVAVCESEGALEDEEVREITGYLDARDEIRLVPLTPEGLQSVPPGPDGPGPRR